MRAQELEAGFAVTSQILPKQMAEVAAAGYRAVICNLPDGEGWLQPGHDKVAEAAKAAGLDFRYIPVSGGIGPDETSAMAEAMTSLPKPIVAFCRSGARSAALWQQWRMSTPA